MHRICNITCNIDYFVCWWQLIFFMSSCGFILWLYELHKKAMLLRKGEDWASALPEKQYLWVKSGHLLWASPSKSLRHQNLLCDANWVMFDLNTYTHTLLTSHVRVKSKRNLEYSGNFLQWAENIYIAVYHCREMSYTRNANVIKSSYIIYD